jgi:hypothetical protein
MTPMSRRLKTAEDLAWLLEHTHAFKGGQVTDLHVQKQRLFDETSGRHVTAGTMVTAVIRYELVVRGGDSMYAVTRVAKLTMLGVTDFSIFEQEGADFSEIGVTHAEVSDGRLRFWFDPRGELYVICDEALIEEVSKPSEGRLILRGMKEWTFQAQDGSLPTVAWLLDHLDRAGYPCAWRANKAHPNGHPAVRWQGDLVLAAANGHPHPAGLHVQTFKLLDGAGFGITLRAPEPRLDGTGRLLIVLADIIAQSFAGTCLCENQVMEPEEWLEAQNSGWVTRAVD